MPVQTRNALAKPFRSRSRRGCLTCRQHRLKCDEKSPKCGGCNRLQRNCRWGLKASFHLSRISELSSSDSAILSEIESGRHPPNTLTFVDETQEIVQEYHGNGKHDATICQHGSIRGAENHSTSSEDAEIYHTDEVTEGYSINLPCQSIQLDILSEHGITPEAIEAAGSVSQPQINSRHVQSLHSQQFPTPNKPTYSTRSNFSIVPLSSHEANVPTSLAERILAWPINDHTKAKLLSLYFKDTSRWCEVTDSTKPFSTLWSYLVIESEVFAAAAVALASIKSLKGDGPSYLLASALYNFACTTLRHLKTEHHGGALLATVLLSMYCSALGKSTEERSILQACAYDLQATTSDSVPDGVLSACFWTFARQDIWAAYSSRQMTIIPTETWKAARYQTDHAPVQDTYSNQAIYLTARVINELFREPDSLNVVALRSLWVELQTWVIERPQTVRCVMEVEASGDSAFPTILFSNPSAVFGNIYYHIASVLLLETGKLSDNDSPIASPVCHARRAIGISITNDEPANLVNNINLISVAARHVPSAVEKITILNHLKDIENQTGWRTKTHIRDLESLWGQ